MTLDLAALRARHRLYAEDWRRCTMNPEDDWPCDAILAANRIETLERALAVLRGLVDESGEDRDTDEWWQEANDAFAALEDEEKGLLPEDRAEIAVVSEAKRDIWLTRDERRRKQR